MAEGGKISLYNLGTKGVNTTKSALHLDDGELASAQNGVPDPRGKFGALTKRDGLIAINGSGTGGSILAMALVPFPAISTTTFYLGIDQDATGAYQFVTSQNGWTTDATWAPGATFAVRSANAFTSLDIPAFYGRMVSLPTRIIFAGNHISYPTAGHAPPPILSYDSVSNQQLVTIPNNPLESATGNASYIQDMLLDGTRLYLISHDGSTVGNLRSRVFMLDLVTNVLTMLGTPFGPDTGSTGGGNVIATTLALHLGMLFVGAGEGRYNQNKPGKIYRIRPGIDTDWTLDTTLLVNSMQTPVTMTSYRGQLYVFSMHHEVTEFGDLDVRSSLGVWTHYTTQLVGDVLGFGQQTSIVFNDVLYYSNMVRTANVRQPYINKLVLPANTAQAVYTLATSRSDDLYQHGVASFIMNGILYFVFAGSNGIGTVCASPDGVAWTETTTNLTTGTTSLFGALNT